MKKMATFRVLKYNQWIMSMLGVYSYRLTDLTNKLFKSIGSYYIIFMLGSCVISSAVFIYLNWPKFELIFEPSIVVCGGTQSFGMYLNIVLQMDKIKILHLKLQEIVEKEGNFWKCFLKVLNPSFIELLPDRKGDIYSIYWSAEQKCRKYTKIIFSYLFYHNSLFVSALFYSFYCIYCGQYDTSQWILPFVMYVPFDTTTFPAWYFLWFIQLNMSTAYIWVMLSITSYFISCCTYMYAICDHFDLLLKSLKQDVDGDENRKENPLEYRNKIGMTVDIHGKLIEWVAFDFNWKL